jgi:hypothetical protein
MTHVPEAERNPRMTRIINDLAQSHPDVKRAGVLASFLNQANGNGATTVRDGHGDDPAGDGAAAVPNRPSN